MTVIGSSMTLMWGITSSLYKVNFPRCLLCMHMSVYGHNVCVSDSFSSVCLSLTLFPWGLVAMAMRLRRNRETWEGMEICTGGLTTIIGLHILYTVELTVMRLWVTASIFVCKYDTVQMVISVQLPRHSWETRQNKTRNTGHALLLNL